MPKRKLESELERRAAEIFGEAVELAPEARTAFVNDACDGSPALRDEVHSLLAAHERDGELPARPDVRGIRELLETDEPDLHGRLLGAYRVLRELGRGGMGTVYLAERADGHYEQLVAVKVVRAGVETRPLLQRFLTERRILARLDHPNVARLLDGGVTHDQRPFLVMEYVDGAKLTDYADRRQLDVEARLRIFTDVCAAVQHAHRNLVVHRDLKPANILVTAEGRLKLLDFGIAKLLEVEEDVDGGTLTGLGFRAMTPEYAAPEQIRGDPVTTATDVYALGAVLYELLSGRRAHRLARHSAAEIERVICETEPEAPSSAARGMRTEAERSKLEGDLDTIVLKALQKDPARRYASVEALGEDLRRHLVGLPVRARPDTLVYRTKKFVRRHARGVVAASAVLGLVVAIVGWYTIRLASERDRATAAAEQAARARDFLVGVIDQANPLRQVGEAGEPTVSDLLHAARSRVDSELSDHPALQAEMGIAVAGALSGLGETGAALELTEQSAARLREIESTRTVQFGRALQKLGTYRSDVGDLPRAEQAFRESIAVLESLLPSDDAAYQLYFARTGLANLLQRAGRANEAVPLRERILAEQLETLGDPDHPDLAWSWHNLAIDYLSVGRFVDAERPLREAERILLAAYGESDPRMVHVWLQLCSYLAFRGEFDASEEYDRKSERMLGDRYADVHPLRASLYRLRARRQLFMRDREAVASARRSVDLYRRGGHFAVGSALHVLGAALLWDGRFEEAAAAFGESHQVLMDLKGPAAAHTRLQQVGRALARWRATGSDAHLEEATATVAAMLPGTQGDAEYLGDAAAWVAAAVEARDPARAAGLRAHAERAMAFVYPAGHAWRTSLAGTRR